MLGPPHLTVVDHLTRENPAIEMAAGIGVEGVVEGSAPTDAESPIAQGHPGVQWPEVHINAPGPVVVPESSGAGLQPTRQARGQRPHHDFQWLMRAEVLGQELVMSLEHAEERQDPGEDITTAKGHAMRWQTCPHWSSPRRGQRRIDPQNSHAD